jgi:chromosomal replication initiator protein
VDFAREQLRDVFRANTRLLTLDDIQKHVAEFFSIRVADMHSPRRSRDVARPRQVAMYLAKVLTSRSYPEIGRAFGGRDHTTVMHACEQVKNLIEKDRELAEAVRLLEKMLGSSR